MGLVSTQQAAEMTGLHVETIRRLCRAGKLRAKRVGRVFVIEERDLRALIANPPTRGRPRKGKTE